MDKEEILRENAEESLLQESHRRRFLYADVETLIETGFLTHTVEIGAVTVAIRSFLPNDLVRLKSRAKNESWTRWTIASAVWMVDGFEIPFDPAENAAFHIYKDWVGDLDRPMTEVLASVITGLRNRLTRAVRMTEAFCYEPYSRGLWRMLGRPHAGLENASVVRRLWVAHNLAEDVTVEESRQWVHTRAIVSSMAGKGAKQLGQALKQVEDKEEERRRKVVEEMVNWVIQGDRKDQKPLIVRLNGQDIEVPKIHSPTTREELEEEMRRVFAGEKDFHDMLVDQYHEGVRKRTEESREARQTKIREARQRQDEQAEREAPTMVGYTREQLAQLNPKILENKTTAHVHESAQTHYMYDRYFSRQLKPGVLSPTTEARGGLEVTEPEPEKLVKPDPEGKPSLQDLIANRKPHI